MSTEPKDIAFNNASCNRDHNIYTEEFFGGADVFIYVNENLHEEISHIQYELREQALPIYSYASRVYDDLAVGTRIVQGAIKIPIKNRADESITSYDNSGYNELTNAGTAEIPDWVYKYEVNLDNVDESQIVNPLADTSKNRAVVARVQSELAKTADIQVNGIVDLPTKVAIAEYKKSNNLTVNTRCDAELTNKIGAENTVARARRKTSLRYMPEDASPTIEDVAQNQAVIMHDTVGSWVLVQLNKGTKGYVKIGDLYV